jgi:hypothetical protein
MQHRSLPARPLLTSTVHSLAIFSRYTQPKTGRPLLAGMSFRFRKANDSA